MLTLTVAALSGGGLFLSGVPIGYLIPTWFLGALFPGCSCEKAFISYEFGIESNMVACLEQRPSRFMNSSISLVQDALYSYRHLPSSKWTVLGVRLPSLEYGITLACIAVAVVSGILF